MLFLCMQVAFRPANHKLHEENIKVNICADVNYLNLITPAAL